MSMVSTQDLTPEEIQTVHNILERMKKGQSERSACDDEGISRFVFRHRALREQMGSKYAEALEALAASQVEKLEQTIEDMRSGVVDAAMARVEIDARKWFASKFLPRRYGESMNLKNDGGKFEGTPIFGGLSKASDKAESVQED